MNSTFDSLIAQGLAASRADEGDTALGCFTQASEHEPGSGLPFFLIGAEHAQAGRVHEAETAFANAVLLAPGMTIARYQLGLLQFASDRLALALVTWQPLMDLPESDALGHFVRGFQALGQNELAQAEARFEQGMRLNHDNPPMNRDIAMVLQQIAKLRGETPAEEVVESEQDQIHVLLANYRPDGTPH